MTNTFEGSLWLPLSSSMANNRPHFVPTKMYGPSEVITGKIKIN